MKLSFPARFPRRPRGNSQPKPQNSRSIQLKVVPPKSAPVPGLLDAAAARCFRCCSFSAAAAPFCGFSRFPRRAR